MTRARKNGPDPSTALAVALLFAVQGFFGALAFGAHAAPLQLDAFGNPLCIGLASFDDGAATPGPGEPAAPTDCCTTGCNAASGLSKLVAPSALLAVAHEAGGVPAPARTARRRSGPARAALRLRGPPRRV